MPDELMSAPQRHILLKYSIFGKGVALTSSPVEACSVGQAAAGGDRAAPAQDDVRAYLCGGDVRLGADVEGGLELGAIIHAGVFGDECLVGGEMWDHDRLEGKYVGRAGDIVPES